MAKHVLRAVVIIFLVLLSGISVFAQDKKEELSSQIEKLQKEIATYQKQLNTISGQRVTLESTLAQQRLEAKQLATELKLVNSQIAKTEKNIGKNRNQSQMTELTVDQQRALLARSVKTLWQTEQQSVTEIWLAGGTWQQVIEQQHAIDQISKTVSGKVEDLTDLLGQLDTEHTTLQSEKQRLLVLQREAKDKKQLYDAQVAETAALVARTKNQEAEFQKEILTREALEKAFESELFAYESSLKFKFDSKTIPAPGTHPLAWPMDNIYITQRFGVTSTSGRLYASGSHSGTDFRGNNDPVYAMADGVVEGVGDTDAQCRGASFGKWVFIRYTNGLASTYGHLALINAREGQKVTRGTLVGYSGNTGHSTAPHLHVSLYVSYNSDGTPAVAVDNKPSKSCKGKYLRQPLAPTTAYLDPLAYMPKASASMFKPGA